MYTVICAMCNTVYISIVSIHIHLYNNVMLEPVGSRRITFQFTQIFYTPNKQAEVSSYTFNKNYVENENVNCNFGLNSLTLFIIYSNTYFNEYRTTCKLQADFNNWIDKRRIKCWSGRISWLLNIHVKPIEKYNWMFDVSCEYVISGSFGTVLAK